MGNEIDTSKPMSETRQMSGRRVIKSSVKEITDGNVVEVLQKALSDHAFNRSEIDYLWNYYKGKQPILNRKRMSVLKSATRLWRTGQTRLSPSRSLPVR